MSIMGHHIRTAEALTNLTDLFAREDLGEDMIMEAVRGRLEEAGRDPAESETVRAGALAGDREAIRLVRSVALPAPAARLAMPVQNLDRGLHRARRAGLDIRRHIPFYG